MTAFIAHIGAYAAFFGLLDALLSREARESFSMYIFGFEGCDFPKMEKALMDSLIGFVLPHGRPMLSLFRLWMVSWAALTLSYSIGSYWTFETGGDGHAYQVALAEGYGAVAWLLFQAAVAISVFATFSLPNDFISARITRAIFVHEQRSLATYPFWILVDAVASLLVWGVLIVAILSIGFFGGEPLYDTESINSFGDYFSLDGFFVALSTGVIFSGNSIVFLSVVQIIALLLGSLTRLLSGALRVNQWLALNSNVHMAPFTFLGILTGIVVYLIWGV
ncbi:hypothetical protein ACOTTU_22690 [Roseobacter sp. EG26]|uniref:hypothetical protein n=1 Tax=Roseobacter sp. EG26 TaxID=3412477 RepID=UPI003CE4697B